jgi:hypothetical protein
MDVRSKLLAVALIGVVACGSPDKKTQSPFAPAPDPNEPEPTGALKIKPWTDAFVKPAVLLARDVRVEGPDGLLEHFVSRQELDIVDIQTKTTPDGLLQTITLYDGVPNGEIRAQLDNLAITCLHRLEVLERPGDVPIVVVATGDAYYQETTSKMEKRGPSLRFEGTVVRTGK